MSSAIPRDRCPTSVRVAVASASCVGGVAVCTVVGGFRGSRAVAPVLFTMLIGAAVPLLLLRSRLPAAIAAIVGSLAVLLTSIATILPGTTAFGLPTLATYQHLQRGAHAVRAAMAGPAPFHAVPGLVMIGAVTAGMAALVSQFLLLAPPSSNGSHHDHRLLALLPTFALVVWASAIGSTWTATLLTATFVVAALAELAVPDRPRAGAPASGPGGGTRRPVPMALPLLGTLTLLAVMVTGMSVEAATASSTGATGGTAPTSELRLLSSVAAIERSNPSTVVFSATTSVPTYWELGVLSTYSDGSWLPSSATVDALDGRSPPVAGPLMLPGHQAGTYRVDMQLGSLAGRLLPLPPDTIDVHAPFGVVRTVGGAVVLGGVGRHHRYSATAAVPPPVWSTPSRSDGMLPPDQLLQYLALPVLPPDVHALAGSITRGSTDPLSSAALLENWFRSGSFHYALTPEAGPAGVAGLLDFLNVSRTGNCEQFAGAFAVLARSIGLPTRILVGFTTGVRDSNGMTVVRGSDAHAWPEVYLGASWGWVSFEPTPTQPSGEVTPRALVGPTRVLAPAPTTTPSTTPGSPTTTPGSPTTTPTTQLPAPTTQPAVSVTSPTAPGTTFPPALAPSPTTAGTSSVGLPWTGILAALIVLATLGILVLAYRRRLYGRDGRRYVGAALPGRCGHAWVRIERALAAAGVTRPIGLSPSAWAARLDQATASAGQPGPYLPGGEPSPATVDAVRSLSGDVSTVAAMLERSVFSPDPPTDAESAVAEAASQRVRHTLRRREVRALLQWSVHEGTPGRPTASL